MTVVVYISIMIAIAAVLICWQVIRRVKKQIAEMTEALADIKDGNGNRRILSKTNEIVAPLAYEMNDIIVSYEDKLAALRQTEENNKQLMTSLSHDVRTPLTTLIGYLDAAHKGIVTGKDATYQTGEEISECCMLYMILWVLLEFMSVAFAQ